MNTNPSSTELETHVHFRFGYFFTNIACHAAITYTVFRYAFPDRFRVELAAPGWHTAIWIAIFGLPLCLFEYFFHRYGLHNSLIPFLKSMHRSHVHHHTLTNVKANSELKIESEYPIDAPHKEESMMFPWYTLGTFLLIFTVVLGPIPCFFFPSEPIFLAIILAVFIYYPWYETIHAIFHLPFRFWEHALSGKGNLSKRLRHMYAFHDWHHAVPTSNLQIVGYFGYALGDRIFGTYKQTDKVPLDGTEVTIEDMLPPKARGVVAKIDKQRGTFNAKVRASEDVVLRRRK